MKKVLPILIFLILVFPSFFALPGELLEAAEKPEKPKKISRAENYIAVVDLETVGKVEKDVKRPLTDSIRLEIVKAGKWTVIERSNMDKIMKEQKFQQSCSSTECIVEVGQLLGVGKMIMGSISLVGKTYYLSLQLVNVETGKIENVSEDECKCEIDDLIRSSKRLVKRLLGEQIESAKETVSEPEAVETPKNNFSLEGLEQKAQQETKKKEKEKAAWNKKTEEMKLAYNKVLDYEKKDISNELKVNAWKHFADSFKEDDPYSQEDDRMRQKAKEQNEYYTAMAKKPASTQGTFTTDTSGIEMVFVKGGCYQMGDTFGDGGSDEKPVHEVCVDDFYVGKYEVTNAQYRQFKSSHDSKDYQGQSLNGDSQPVVYVSWEDAVAYAEWLSNKTGKKYRLPTEAEWEYAAKAGTNSRNYWGSSKDDACKYANVHDRTSKNAFSSFTWENHNCDDGYAVTAPVGKFQPNAFGLYDMMGNVWEWTSDWYGDKFYDDSPKNNPKGPNTRQYRVLRGGSWLDEPQNVRASYRTRSVPTFRNASLGFRVVFSAR